MRLWADGIAASSVKVWRLGLMLPLKSGLGDSAFGRGGEVISGCLKRGWMARARRSMRMEGWVDVCDIMFAMGLKVVFKIYSIE